MESFCQRSRRNNGIKMKFKVLYIIIYKMAEMNKYRLYSKIYVVKSPNTDKVYVGSTVQIYLSNRMTKHRTKVEKVSSSEVVDAGDSYIELLEKFPCECKEELKWRERYWIEKLRSEDVNVVNKIRPTRTLEEKKACQDAINAQTKIVEARKIYRETHREQIRAHKNTKHMCECGIEYTQANKNRHLATKPHQKFLETGELQFREAENVCECGGRHTTQHRTTHAKSKKHIKWLESQQK